MENDKFEIFVEDVGDASVGISPLTVLKAELDENMVEHLRENKLLGEFEQKHITELMTQSNWMQNVNITKNKRKCETFQFVKV